MRKEENKKRRFNGQIAIENARLIWTNFSGIPDRFNRDGKITFNVIIDPEDSERLKSDGWNIKEHLPKDDDGEILYTLKVNVGISENRVPKIILISSRGRTILKTKEEIATLDWCDKSNVDLIISPYNYDVNGRVGIAAYLKAMYITLDEDEFEHKYIDIPDAK